MTETDQDELFMIKPCPVCGGQTWNGLYPIDISYAEHVSGLHITGNLPKVVSCAICGHEFIQPLPTVHFIRAFYSSYMGQAKLGFYNGRAMEIIPPNFRERYVSLLYAMRALSPDACTLLDIGAGLGMFLRLAKEFGLNVQGIEPSLEAAQTITHKYGIIAENCLLEEASGLGRMFDIITMWDLLEHLTDPMTALKKSYELLNNNGILVVEIPVRDSLIHWLAKSLYVWSNGFFRRPLYLVCGVHHLQYFSVESFVDLLTRCGFVVEKQIRRGTEYSAMKKHSGNYLTRTAYNLVAQLLLWVSRLLGKENKLVVFARKRT